MFKKFHKHHNPYPLEMEYANILFKKYPESKKMLETIRHIKDTNPKIRKLFNRHAVELSKHDTKDLLRIIDLQNKLLIMERDIYEIKGAKKAMDYIIQIEEMRNERSNTNGKDNP